MTLKSWSRRVVLCFGVPLLVAAAQALAVPVTHFSSTSVLTYGSAVPDIFTEIITNQNPLYTQKNSDTSGNNVNGSLSYSGSEGTGSAQAQASLSGGTLKAKAQSTSDGTDPFTNNGFAFARADIGDSFRAVTNQGPFQWSSGTEVTFSMDFSGFVNTGTGVNSRADAGFFISIFTPGYLDSYAQWLLFGAPFPTDLFDNRIIVEDYHLGGELFSFQIPVGALPAMVDFTFAPGGDFDWAAGLFTDTAASLTDTSTANFFDTAVMSYNGPAGATTLSASGLFPGTQALNTVPEPATFTLMGLALLALGFVRKKRATLRSS